MEKETSLREIRENSPLNKFNITASEEHTFRCINIRKVCGEEETTVIKGREIPTHQVEYFFSENAL